MHFQSIALAVTGSIIMRQVGASLILDMIIDQKDISPKRVIENGRDVGIMECCPHDAEGYCKDGSRGTPYCAYGECNVFGCNCDGGCRSSKNAYNHNLASEKMIAQDERGQEREVIAKDCCHATHTRDDGQPLCDDETEATPYCGLGQCNIFGCECDGGCREPKTAFTHNANRQKTVAKAGGAHALDCCPADRDGHCADGTIGNPYCGYGECNIFGCNCDGGCRHQ